VTGSSADIFVSYKAEDRTRLALLVEALEAEGFTVWWDAHIGGGKNWHEDIEENLASAKCVIVAWSKRSIGHEGHFVRDEARRAQRRGAYLPIRLDVTEPPLGFGEIQAISLKGWHGDRSDPRFVALADAVRECITGEHIAHHPTHQDRRGISRRVVVAGSAGIGAAAIAGAGGWLLLKPAPANTKRIAVLPFENLSTDPEQAYFAEGIAEELRAALSRIGLQVIGRNSCDAVKDLDIKTAATKLDVANILTGSVRRSPETIRVNAQLVSGKDGVERWAQSYDRVPGDAIKIQTDIAAKVAQALSIALGEAGLTALTLGGTADTLAQDLLLQSKNLVRQNDSLETLRRRLALADGAIARDPGYADAYIEKAIVLVVLAPNYSSNSAENANRLAEAKVAIGRAITIAPKLGSARAVLAEIDKGNLDFASALRHTKQSLALSPADLDVLSFGSRNFANFESPQEGLRIIERAIALDPLNGRIYRFKSELLVYLRQYPQAIEAGRRALELAPEIRNAHVFVGDALLLLGQPAKAEVEYQAIPANNPNRLAREAIVAARTGDIAGAKQRMARIKRESGALASYQYGEIYAQLGDKDRAFVEFDNAISAKDVGLIFLKVDPFLDPIRDDPRYAALLKKLNFP
jgi:serine/threonine-protein kinase